MLTWQQWKQVNSDKIQHIVGYEERFVDEILCRIPEIEPTDVIAQYHFKDNQSGNRYIDFMIKNEAKGYCLPIELDGYDKINNKGYARFNDFLERQNDLIKLFGIVLRYTNKKAFLEQDKVIAEISEALRIQADRQVTEQFKQKQVERLITEYEEKLAAFESELQQQRATQFTLSEKDLAEAKQDLALFKTDHSEEIRQLQTELSTMKEQQLQQFDSVKKEVKKQFRMVLTAGFALLIAIIAFFFNKENTSPASSSALGSETAVAPIKASQAKNHIGEQHTVCGQVVHIHPFSNGLYLNLDKAYPNTPLTVVVWDKNPALIQKVQSIANKNLCVWGEITQFNKQTQIILNSETQLR